MLKKIFWSTTSICLSAWITNSFAESYDLLFGVRGREMLVGKAELILSAYDAKTSGFQIHSEFGNLSLLDSAWDGSLSSAIEYRAIPELLAHLEGTTTLKETITFTFFPDFIHYVLTVNNGGRQLAYEIMANHYPKNGRKQILLKASVSSPNGATERFVRTFSSNLPLGKLRNHNIFPLNRHQGYQHGEQLQQLYPGCWTPSLFHRSSQLQTEQPAARSPVHLEQNNRATVHIGQQPFASLPETASYHFVPETPLEVSGLIQYYGITGSEFSGMFLGWQQVSETHSLIYQVSSAELEKKRQEIKARLESSDSYESYVSEDVSDEEKVFSERFITAPGQHKNSRTRSTGSTNQARNAVDLSCSLFSRYLQARYFQSKHSPYVPLLLSATCSVISQALESASHD